MDVVLLIAGLLASIIGVVKLVVAAFRKSLVWGLGTLIVPFVGLFFIITNWKEQKASFFWIMAGLLLLLAGSALAPGGLTGRSAPLLPGG